MRMAECISCVGASAAWNSSMSEKGVRDGDDPNTHF